VRARSLLAALAVVLCLGLVVSGIAGAREAAKTRVTIKGEEGEFHGRLFSSKGKCPGDRKVKVYKLRGNGYDPAHDEKIASDLTDRAGNNGVWSVGNTGARSGDYYALARKSPGCKRAFSKVLSL
jgi:hypothetical protein